MSINVSIRLRYVIVVYYLKHRIKLPKARYFIRKSLDCELRFSIDSAFTELNTG